jgi:hypothetical protein
MARTADAKIARLWRERLARWQRADLSVAEFCRRERVSEPSFYQWRRRLRPVDGDAPRFVELPAWPSMAAVQMTLPSGAVVTIPAQASADMIRAVIRAALPPAGEDPRC